MNKKICSNSDVLKPVTISERDGYYNHHDTESLKENHYINKTVVYTWLFLFLRVPVCDILPKFGFEWKNTFVIFFPYFPRTNLLLWRNGLWRWRETNGPLVHTPHFALITLRRNALIVPARQLAFVQMQFPQFSAFQSISTR